MPLTFQLVDQTIHFETRGDVVYQSGLEVLRQGLLAAGTRGPGPWHLWFDIRASEENRPEDDLRGIAAVIAAQRAILSGRCAIVVAQPLHFGLARMFGVFMESLGFTVHVGYDPATAQRWLNAAPSDNPS